MDLTKNELTLYVHNEKHTINPSEIEPNTTLNTYLRSILHLTGTKRMCVEGGCGACIVAAQKRDPHTGRSEVFAVNSCLVSIFSCYGWNIFTAEGIGSQDKPHTVQEVLANFNGTQCGYCSPGMVMNMFALSESQELTMKNVENSFGGNICRCTGYRPILSAFKSICKDASKDLLGTYPDIEDIKLCNKICTKSLDVACGDPFTYKLEKSSWVKVYQFDDLVKAVRSFHFERNKPSYKLIAGNTGRGVYRNPPEVDIYIDVLNVAELVSYQVTEDEVHLGANVSLTKAMSLFYELSEKKSQFQYLKGLADHIDLIANVPVRNMGTLGGNLMMKHQRNDFPSDIYLIFEAAAAQFQIIDIKNKEYLETPLSFLQLDMSDKILKKIILPSYGTHFKYESYKIMPRAQNAHALVNAGFLLELDPKNIVKSARIVFGNINPHFVRALQTEQYLKDKNLFDNNILEKAFETIATEVKPDFILGEPNPEFRKQLAISLFYKFVLSITPKNLIDKRNVSGGVKFDRPVSTGSQDYETNESLYPLSEAIPKIEALAQTTGEAQYITDIPDLPNQLFASFVLAKAPANYTINKINTDKALKLKGVVAFFDKNDIPGRNTFTPPEAGSQVQYDEELFCSGKVLFCNQPLGIVVAKTQDLANKAADLIEVTYTPSNEKPLLNIREILKADAKHKIVTDDSIKRKSKGTDIKHVAKGTVDLSWQYHFHMELQCCNVVPTEDSLDIYPATQWMELAQVAASVALNIPSNKINVYIRRLGGAFGGKITRSSIVSTACALAAHKLKKPVKMWLTLEQNVAVIGKRYPLSCDYEIAVDNNGIIQYMDNCVYYDYGIGENEKVMMLLIEIMQASYNSDTFKVDSFYTKSDMHAACFTRAPGSCEGMAVLEGILEHIAYEAGLDPLEFRIKNMKDKELLKYIEDHRKWADIDNRKKLVEEFNKENRWKKRGLSVMPMKFPFGLFFQYSAFITIYQADGTVSIAHGGVEMGQGINTKVAQVCAYKLGIPLSKVSVKPSNNLTNPNTSPSGGSITSEAVCLAVVKTCDILLERMKPIKDKMQNATWEQIVKQSFLENVNLTASALPLKREPNIEPYDIYGVCSAEIELDVLTGQYQILRIDLLEDAGNAISPQIDIGQVEGSFIMGLGYFLTELTVVNEDGAIISDRTWNYKPPGAKDIPIDFRVKFPKNNPNEVGVLKSKEQDDLLVSRNLLNKCILFLATGEPPLCLAFSVPLAIRQAVSSVRKETGSTISKWYMIDGPSTVEQTFTNCLHDYKQYKL